MFIKYKLIIWKSVDSEKQLKLNVQNIHLLKIKIWRVANVWENLKYKQV